MRSHYELAQLVAASYGEAPTARAGDDVRAVIKTLEDELVIVCPGSTDVVRWWRDFETWPAHWGQLGWVHNGFGSGGEALYDAVRSDLLDAHCNVTFAGHSLGGALAQAVAVLFSRRIRRLSYQMRVVAFGSPRVALAPPANMVFRANLKSANDLTLYARIDDPVPHMPPWPLFAHAARLTRIGKPVAGDDPLANHGIGLYVSDLATLATARTTRRRRPW